MALLIVAAAIFAGVAVVLLTWGWPAGAPVYGDNGG
jgi:hypothetical protein